MERVIAGVLLSSILATSHSDPNETASANTEAMFEYFLKMFGVTATSLYQTNVLMSVFGYSRQHWHEIASFRAANLPF
jgi:hypothetical protein